MSTGPEEGAAGYRGHLRAAHADREHVIDLLKAAFVEGRLTKDELEARAGQALTARTYADLAPLTADIPASPLTVRPPRSPRLSRPPARQRNGPARTPGARNAAIASASCLTATFLLFLWAVRLDDHASKPILGAAFYVFIVGLILAAGAVVELKRSRGHLPPRPGRPRQIPPGQSPGSTGHQPSPPSPRAGQARADRTRADYTRSAPIAA